MKTCFVKSMFSQSMIENVSNHWHIKKLKSQIHCYCVMKKCLSLKFHQCLILNLILLYFWLYRYGFRTVAPSGEKKSTRKKDQGDQHIMLIRNHVPVNRYRQMNYEQKKSEFSFAKCFIFFHLYAISLDLLPFTP